VAEEVEEVGGRGKKMVYFCLRCKKIVETTAETQSVRCPYCGFRALKKGKPELVVKTMKAK